MATAERWARVKEILDAALDLTGAARDAYLEQACGADESLRAEVESLLAEEAASLPLLDWPPDHAPENAATKAVMGRRIGPYQLLRELGHGGMGTVFLAKRADAQFQQLVALKLIKRGMDTDSILRRFRNERQILAALNHPNIARLLDGGQTSDGLPYLVMEYIEGQPLDVYCRANKLALNERLRLFEQVCAAVHFAHQHLVVHRDLKPGNILVTKDGVPKLLDFGIAKFLAPELGAQTLDPTTPTLRLLTPAYASPEQVKGEPVTTASDVYSLGVLLYELLTGQSPYRAKTDSPHELLRAVLEDAPERPSQREKKKDDGERLTEGQKDDSGRKKPKWRVFFPPAFFLFQPSEWDNIVLMALRKEPARRYASVEQLAQDIRRYLSGQPVLAHQDLVGYRAWKFVQRHKAGVAAAAVFVLAVLAGVLATVWQARVAAQQRDRAERRFNDVRVLVNDVLFKYYDELEKLPGSTALRETLVRDAVNYLDKLAREASGDVGLQRELALGYLRTGDIRGKPYAANLGDSAGALDSYRKARDLLTQLRAQAPGEAALVHQLSQAYESIGNLEARTLNERAALSSQQQALALRTELLALEPENTENRRALAAAQHALGSALWSSIANPSQLAELRQALGYFEQARATRAALAAQPQAGARDRLALAGSVQALGHLQLYLGDWTRDRAAYGQAFEYLQQACALHESLLALEPGNARYRRNLADALMNLSDAHARLEQAKEALAGYQKSHAIFAELAHLDPTNAEARRDQNMLAVRLGDWYRQAGEARAAAWHYRQALHSNEQLYDADATRTEDLFAVLHNYARLADLALMQTAVATFADVVGYEHRLTQAFTQAEAGRLNGQFAQRLARQCLEFADQQLRLPDASAKRACPRAHRWQQRGLTLWPALRQQPGELQPLLARLAAGLSQCGARAEEKPGF